MSNVTKLSKAHRARMLGNSRSGGGLIGRRALRDQDIITAIDIGGSRVACVIAQLVTQDDGGCEPEVIGVGQQGGLPRDCNHEIEDALRAAVEAAERMAGERIKSVYAAAGGRALSYRRIGVDLDIAGGCVTGDDVVDCLAEGAQLAAPEGSTALHAMPILYAVDGERTLGDPAGMMGSLLTAEMLGVAVRDTYAANITALLERCGFDLQELIAAPFAAGEAVLIEDEKDLGVVLIDIGARSTDFAVYEDGSLVACGGVGLGGEHITRDIAQIFGSPIAHAERVKTLYGAAFSSAGDEHRFVDFPQLGDPADVVRASRADVAAVIAPRMEEILGLVRKALPANANGAAINDQSSVRRAVLSGGGSLLVGAREAAEKVLGVKVRLGRPDAFAGAPDAATAPQYSVCSGMIQYAAGLAARKGARAHFQGREAVYRDYAQKRGIGEAGSNNGLFGGVGAWLRANF